MEKAVTCKGPNILVHGNIIECVNVYPTRVCASTYCTSLPFFTLLWTIDVPIGLPVPATLRFPPCN